MHHLPLDVLGKAEGVVATVEGNKLTLEEDITVDLETTCGTGLDTTEAVWEKC